MTNIESAVSTSTTMMFLWFLFAIAIFAFNQCNSNTTGRMTFAALRYPPLLACLVTLTTHSLQLGLTTHSSQTGLMTYPSHIPSLMTHSSHIPSLMTHSSHIGFITYSSQSSNITYPSHTGLATCSLQIGIVGLSIWPSFSGLATQPITQSASHTIQFPFIQKHTYTHIFASKLRDKMKRLAWPFIQYDILSFMDCSHSIDQLIARIIMKLRRYITRRHDFVCYWIDLLLSALLQMRCNKIWSLLIMALWLGAIAVTLFPFLWIPYIIISRNKKRVVQKFYLMLVYLWFGISVIVSFHSSDLILQAHEKNIKCRFVGGGASARTDYELLKPYLISTENQIQNPEEYKYIYDGHFTFDKASQIVQMTGDKHIICNIPVGHIAGILTTDQANQIAKDHNLQALSRKSLAEKRKAIKSHICTKSCSQCVTVFKAVNINKRDLKKQSDNKKKNKNKTKSQSKRYWEKPKRTKVNHKYYTKNNARFPPSPPSNRLMHKIITGFCNDTHPSKFEEAGCAICGQLVVMSDLIELANVKCSLDPLVRVGVTRLP